MQVSFLWDARMASKLPPNDSKRPGLFKLVFLCSQGGDFVFGGSVEPEATAEEGSCQWRACLGEASWEKSTRIDHSRGQREGEI